MADGAWPKNGQFNEMAAFNRAGKPGGYEAGRQLEFGIRYIAIVIKLKRMAKG